MTVQGVIAAIYVVLLAHFLTVQLIYFLLLLTSLAGAARRWRESRETDLDRLAESSLTMPVSVIVPAWNEEAGVVHTVQSVLRSRHPQFEVLVVDDGSTDATVRRLVDAFDLTSDEAFYPEPLETEPVEQVLRSRVDARLRVLRKRNGGKADAVNAGVNIARYRWLALTDADCVFHPEALLRVCRAIGRDPEHVVAAGGQLRLLNGMRVRDGEIVEMRQPRSLVARFQVVEYLGAFIGNRIGWSVLNGVPVLSGGFSAWRRDVVLELDGFTEETTHEDIEMTLRIHEAMRRRREPYRIVSLPDPIVWTEGPERWRDLYMQRKRWQRVVFECVWRFRRMLFNPRYGVVGTMTMPHLLLYEALGPFLELAAWGLTIWLAIAGLLDWSLLGLFLLLLVALNAATRILSLATDAWHYGAYPPRALITLPLLALLEYPIYRPTILAARVVAFLEFLTGRRTWERVQRSERATA